MSFKYLKYFTYCLIITFTINLRAQALLGVLPQGNPIDAFEAFKKQGFEDAFPNYPGTRGKALKGFILGQEAIIKIFAYQNEIESFELSYPEFGSNQYTNWNNNKNCFYDLREKLTHKYHIPTTETLNDNGVQINEYKSYELKDGTIFNSIWNINDKYEIELVAMPGIYLTYYNKLVIKNGRIKNHPHSRFI